MLIHIFVLDSNS